MGAASSVAASGALVAQAQLRSAAFNIAKSPVFGAKEKFLNITNMTAQESTGSGAGIPVSDQGNVQASNITKGLGVKIQGETTIFTQGPIKMTQATYDMAIQGNGFFVVNFPDGRRAYTRAGNFKKTGEGEIVTQNGLSVSPGIVVPGDATAVVINESGEVWVTLQGQDPQNLGQIELATFTNPSGLEEGSDGLWYQVDPNDNPVIGAPGTDGRGTVIQGSVEESNIEVVKQLVEAMAANNTFALLMKIIEADKEQGKQIAQAA